MPSIRPLEPSDAEQAGYEAHWIGPSGSDVHRAGLWDGSALVGAVQVTPSRRTRWAHTAEVGIRADSPDDAGELLEALGDFTDRWTAVDRLNLAIPADHPAAVVAALHGFDLEVRRVDRWGPGRDELAFGRLRPGFVPRPLRPPPPWPDRHRRAPGEVVLRPVAPDDAAALRDLSTELTTAWGTLQTPWSNERHYVDRHRATDPATEPWVIVVDGEVAGNAAVHPNSAPGVFGLGMGMAARWQGCGLGARLLDHVMDRARIRGARRIELGVWEDNDRARSLYASRGFVPEGVLRFDGIRDGSHASSLEMAYKLSV